MGNASVQTGYQLHLKHQQQEKKKKKGMFINSSEANFLGKSFDPSVFISRHIKCESPRIALGKN